jgi:peptidoglycan/LPS O-acetylase OafA/YrhL
MGIGKLRTKRKGRYIAGLDGLRALAVIAVVAYHLAPAWVPGGYIGVDIFFVISGFLITTLLIDEYRRTGAIDFKKFWGRRARRLLPALFVTIGIVCSVAFFIRGDMLVGLGRQILGAATFSNNWVEVAAGTNYFDANNAHLFTNFWSLAVEEQFYVVWPFVIAGMVGFGFLARRSKLGIMVSVLLGGASAALMAWHFSGTNATRVYYGTDTHLFGLMAGAALAFWLYAKTVAIGASELWSPGKRWWLRIVGGFSMISLMGLMVVMSDQSPLAYKGGLLSASILTAFVVLATISARGILQRIFTVWLLEWLGVRSYGIYLWHWPLLILSRNVLPANVSLAETAVVTCALTLCAAALSYRYLEAPIRAEGFRTFLQSRFTRPMDTALLRWRLLPHPVLLGGVAVIVLTFAAVIVAPTKTKAQLSIEAGQSAIRQAQQQAAKEAATAATQVAGSNMTAIGDSVTLASAPALQAKFPGIVIDAEISRSMRRGGLETIENYESAGKMRSIAIIALGTNGYYGDGNLERMVNELGARKIVLVTSYADREWIAGNNTNVYQIAAKHRNVYVANWDAAIGSHPEDLNTDHIHPTAAGGAIYADSIATALAKHR